MYKLLDSLLSDTNDDMEKLEDLHYVDFVGQETPVSEPDWTEHEEARARRK